ncbi:nucleotidyltransferase domain-containing protein [Microaerobacter geothermalis]|uniref:nucleotidyltransferase family protein n=1 Tax=Microaerobacter geothermalis TaxID=674972 RepID=UPI001F26349C|nr:nucleotidyltransferase domain-containing protein [Microaerobacter geothermalis]MCF6092539.1 nucleotidyltransferase domain-containing protein [Microaerobacter geothermalis]
MKFGLSDQDINDIVQAISRFDEIEKAVIFGSRAKGNYKRGSDIDIAIYGEKINIHTLSKLHALLEDESNMPYFFDVIDGTHLKHEDLKEHIARVGEVIFER